MRNAEHTIRSFIYHYRDVGAARIVILDNGSTDRTVSIVREHREIKLLRCRSPFRRYETALRRHLLRIAADEPSPP